MKQKFKSLIVCYQVEELPQPDSAMACSEARNKWDATKAQPESTSMTKPSSTSILTPGCSWWSPPCEETELIRTSFSPGVATSSLCWESSLILLMQNRFTKVCCIFPYLQSRVHWRGSCSSGSPGGVSPHLFTTKISKPFQNASCTRYTVD